MELVRNAALFPLRHGTTHLLQRERMTKVDKELLERAWNLHTDHALPEN